MPKKKKECPVPSEYAEQCHIFRLARTYAMVYPELRFLAGSLSGVKLTIGQAVKAKNAGCLVKGIPDISLPVRRGKYSGIFIELKRRKGGRVEPEQKVWGEFLLSQGYQYHICKGAEEAWKAIEEYLKGDKNG